MEILRYDVLIIGGGTAGLKSALEASKNKDISVAIISKVHPLRSQSCMAQGGMNAALNNEGEDSIKSHIEDTFKGGDDFGNKKTIEFFCEHAPEEVIDLEHLGMIFSRNENGTIAQRPFGGGMHPRTCFSRDYTGHNLLNLLYTEILKNDVEILDEWFVHSLIVKGSKITGLYAFDIETGKIHKINAKSIILATGGAGNLYANTTNAVISTGDGMAIANRAGAELINMEFIQFHPTTLLHKPLLISEGTRGEGAHLKNSKGIRFVDELAPRDKVARAIQTEINEGRDVGGGVLLDMTHLNKKIVQEKLHQIYTLVKTFTNIDCTREAIPVKPGAHYMMGGIKTNINCETSIKGLYAVGECACNEIHGANRLGGNSLMETIVFGKVVGKNAAKYAENSSNISNKEEYNMQIKEDLNNLLKKSEGENLYKLKNDLQETMEKHAGIFRNEDGLKKGLEKIENYKNLYKNVCLGNSAKSYNLALYEYFELGNLILLADNVLKGALNREKSCGAHYRTDYNNNAE